MAGENEKIFGSQFIKSTFGSPIQSAIILIIVILIIIIFVFYHTEYVGFTGDIIKAGIYISIATAAIFFMHNQVIIREYTTEKLTADDINMANMLENPGADGLTRDRIQVQPMLNMPAMGVKNMNYNPMMGGAVYPSMPQMPQMQPLSMYQQPSQQPSQHLIQQPSQPHSSNMDKLRSPILDDMSDSTINY